MIILLSILLILQQPQHWNIDRDKIGLEGYDPVSYWNMDKPSIGREDIFLSYKGVVYRFETEDNKRLFSADPTRYLPAYGGWCAYAMGQNGEKVKIDPETYKIKNGQLFLFYNFWGNNTLIDWNKNEMELKKNADNNWDQITKS